MRMGLLAASAALVLATSAFAQPTATSLGTIAIPGTIDNTAETLDVGEVQWYTFTTSAPITAAARTYLDIWTAGSLLTSTDEFDFPDDTMIAVYDATGTGIVMDDDSGPGFTSGLSFGIGSNTPLGGAGGAISAGGFELPTPGTYYLAVAGYFSTFFIDNWNVQSESLHSGSLQVHMATGTLPPAVAPTATDLGNVGVPANVTGSVTLAGADVFWFRMNLTTAISLASNNFMDITTNTTVDSMIALYTATGDGIVVDDDSGPGLASGLSFGAGSGQALGGAGGAASTGQSGATVAAGTYYIAVTGFGGSFFGLHDWNVSSTHAQAGEVGLSIVTGTVTPPDGWIQQGTPGNTPGTAQVVAGTGTLPAINGQHAASGEAHVYRINICSPANFSASTSNAGTAGDTQLFLFRLDGTGIAMDDDNPAGGLTSALSNAFTASLAPGEYLIGISRYDSDPLDASGLAIWADTPFGVERAPDGPGASGVLTSWDAGASGTGRYRIEFQGACYAGGSSNCAADTDDGTRTGTPDGAVTIDDLIYFLIAFEDGNLDADLDNGTRTGTTDGAVTIDDLVYFLIRFEEGC